MQWGKEFSGTLLDESNSIVTTPYGGYIFTGSTYSNDGDFEGWYKSGDEYGDNVFVFKVDRNGNIQWKKFFGGDRWDTGSTIIATNDRGYIVAGRTMSPNGDFHYLKKDYAGDIFVIKLDKDGDVSWKKVFGGSKIVQEKGVKQMPDDYATSIAPTRDGGCILTGGTYRAGDGDFVGQHCGKEDIFIIKLDDRGEVVNRDVLGGKKRESGVCITTAPDGAVVLTGHTSSKNGDVHQNMGGNDIFIIRLDQNGYLITSEGGGD